jgi:hypothetical protein
MKKIRFIKSSGTLVEKKLTQYVDQPEDQFIEMYLPDGESYEVVNENEKADICFFSVQLEDESLLRDDELNVFFSIENFEHWGPIRKHYKHYNKFGSYGTKKKDIYISSNHSSPEITPDYKIIPNIYCRINHYNKVKEYWKQKYHVPFEQKKFVLFTSRNALNTNKLTLHELLKSVGEIDYITEYPSLKNESCYHSEEIIKIFSQYKFIVCFENSHTPGYISEKIFNGLMAHTIPIYDGAPDIDKFINKQRFVCCDKNIINKIKFLKDNEKLYNHIVSSEAICEKYQNIKIEY